MSREGVVELVAQLAPFVVSLVLSFTSPFVSRGIFSGVMSASLDFSEAQKEAIACIAQSQVDKVVMLQAFFGLLVGILVHFYFDSPTLLMFCCAILVLCVASTFILAILGQIPGNLASVHFSLFGKSRSMSDLWNFGMIVSNLMFISSITLGAI